MASPTRNPSRKYVGVSFLRMPKAKYPGRRRSSRSPSPAPPTPPQEPEGESAETMAQRSALARKKLDKEAGLSGPAQPSHGLKATLSSFFHGPRPATASANKQFAYLLPAKTSSTASLPLPPQPLRVNNPHVQQRPPLSAARKNSDETMMDEKSMRKALCALREELAAVIAQNNELRALLFTEREYSAKLCQYLQQHHESHGRINPDKGNLNSSYYADLVDEDGNPLIPADWAETDAQSLFEDEGDDESKSNEGDDDDDAETGEITIGADIAGLNLGHSSDDGEHGGQDAEGNWKVMPINFGPRKD